MSEVFHIPLAAPLDLPTATRLIEAFVAGSDPESKTGIEYDISIENGSLGLRDRLSPMPERESEIRALAKVFSIASTASLSDTKNRCIYFAYPDNQDYFLEWDRPLYATHPEAIPKDWLETLKSIISAVRPICGYFSQTPYDDLSGISLLAETKRTKMLPEITAQGFLGWSLFDQLPEAISLIEQHPDWEHETLPDAGVWVQRKNLLRSGSLALSWRID